MKSHQAEIIIAKFGGVDRLAAAIGRHRTRVLRWTYPRERGGTDGIIPGPIMKRILQAAELLEIEITMEDMRA
jgi:hypothetical protein